MVAIYRDGYSAALLPGIPLEHGSIPLCWRWRLRMKIQAYNGWQVLAGHPPVLAWLCGEVSQEELDCLTAALIRDGVERILVMLSDKPVCYLSAKEEAA
jgi:hypothetical protein